jgi:Complex 1 protein (LYR family)
LDPRKDFKFFLMRAKVCQVYREALKECRLFRDPSTRTEMQVMIKGEFRVFRRDPADQGWRLDVGQIEYQLALMRKQINMIKEWRDRVA